MKVAKELFADYVKEKKLRYFYTFRNKLSVQFIISSLRLRLIIPTSSLINLDIKKTSSSNCLIWYYQKPEAYVCFCQKFLISLNYILTCALILTCKHWDSLICTYLDFFHLYALTFTCMHLHSLVCTYLHLHTLTFTCMHLHHLHALTFTCIHLHSLVCTYFICTHLPSLIRTYLHLYTLAVTCTLLEGSKGFMSDACLGPNLVRESREAWKFPK